MSSINSLQKAAMRPGDFHLRRDSRQMFGNYVELSPAGGSSGALKNVRRSASFVETPTYDAPKLWKLTVEFSAPNTTPPAPLSPWVPPVGGTVALKITVRTALDRDKMTATTEETIVPLDVGSSATALHAFSGHFVHGHQVGVKVEAVAGGAAVVVGVQVSIVPVENGDRDGYGNAVMLQFPADDAVSTLFLPENAHRRQFFVQNMAASPLYVAFGELAIGPSGGGPQWTVALINVGDIYESPRDCWRGAVSGIWDAAAAAASDVAVVTEGT